MTLARTDTLRRLPRATVRLLLLLTAASTVALTGFFFVREVVQANPPAFGHYSSHATSSTAGRCPVVQTPLPRLTFIVTGLDAQTGLLNLAVFLCMSQSAEQHIEYALRRDRRYRYLVTRPVPEEPFSGLPSRLTFEVEYDVPQEGEADYSQRHEHRLWNLYTLDSGYGRKLGDFKLPLAGSEASYPLDRFSGHAELKLALEEDGPTSAQAFWCAHGPIVCTKEFTTTLPTVGAFIRGPGIAPYKISATMRGGRFQISLARPLATQGFVLAVALIPLLLACVLALVLFGGRTRSGGVGADSVTGIVAVLLAILPIRLVLVPAEVSELTLVDYLLGFEMAVLTGVAALAVRRDLRVRAAESAGAL